MNTPLRKLSVAVLLLFAVMLVSTNYLQVVRASDYADRPGNVRVTEREYAHERGPILVGDAAEAKSTKTADRLEYLRSYPGGEVYAPVTGFYSLIYGKTGVEAALDDVLSGEDSRLFVRRVSDLVTGRTLQGGAVVLTIDPRAQRAAYTALGNHRGAVVALDPRTGAILAMVSRPSYDPSELSSHDPKRIRAAHARLLKAEGNPLLNRALQQSYPPGSLFKVVTSAAALSSGRYRPDTQIDAPDQLKLPGVRDPLQNFGGEHCSSSGKQSLADALRISCNTAFASLGLSLGQDALRHQAELFGFNEGIRVPLSAAASRFPDHLDRPATAQSAIGQRDVQVTPLQAAMIVAAVANHGSLMRPYLVSKVLSPDLSEL
ncbi:MAG: penicillin-binding protein, partial [Frankiaceae bacterium]|nr:penicillin-binding protein [Frankiaceae bacterium]